MSNMLNSKLLGLLSNIDKNKLNEVQNLLQNLSKEDLNNLITLLGKNINQNRTK